MTEPGPTPTYNRVWPIVKNELRRRRWSIFWWVIGIVAYLTLVLAVYPTFRDQAALIDKSLQGIPASARSLFTDTTDFLSPIGYLSSQIYYLMLPLLLAFLGISLGSSLIANEEQQHTIELLLSRPVSRTKLLLSKALVGGLILLAVSLVAGVVGALEVAIIKFDGVQPGNVFMVTMMSFGLALLFGSIAFALTAMSQYGRRVSVGIAASIALGGYIISSLDKTVTWLAWPAKLLPFHYYQPAVILTGHFSIRPMVGILLICGCLLAFAIIGFRRRDLD